MTHHIVDHSTSLPPGLFSAGLLPWEEAMAEPSRNFTHPQEVIAASDLSREEKRTMLAAWASDAWAAESAPGLRYCPGLAGRTVPLDTVLDALRSLDPETVVTPCERPEPAHRTRKAGVRWFTPRLPQVNWELEAGHGFHRSR